MSRSNRDASGGIRKDLLTYKADNATNLGIFADDYDSIALAIADAKIKGIGKIYLSAKTYEEPFELSNGIHFVGQGSKLTEIKLPDGANTDLIKTEDFDTLTGTNKWLVSEGVPTGFGLIGLRVNGNKANNISGSGVKIYGKRYIIDDVIIIDSAEYGFYSECAAKAGQEGWDDLPEAYINRLYTRNSGGDGIVIKGPHDHRMDFLVSALSGSDGVRFEYLADTYASSGNVGFIHSYANQGHGVVFEDTVQADQIVGESNVKSGIVINSNKTQISIAYAYQNDSEDSGLYPDIDLQGANNNLSNTRIRNTSASGGIIIAGLGNKLGELEIAGNNTAGVGVDVQANHTQIKAMIVSDFSAVGGVGLKTGEGVVLDSCQIAGSVLNCETGWDNVTTGKRNKYDLNIFGTTPQVAFTGQGPASGESEKWNVNASVSDVELQTFDRGQVTIPIGTYYVTVNHKALITPLARDITIKPVTDISGGGITNVWVTNITTTTFDIRVNTNVAGVNQQFAWEIRL